MRVGRGGLNKWGRTAYGSNFEPNETYIEHIARRTRENADKGKEKARASWKRKVDYLHSMHDYRMKVGETYLGPVITMSGFDAVRRNRALEQKYIKHLDEGKNTRLSRWCINKIEPSV